MSRVAKKRSLKGGGRVVVGQSTHGGFQFKSLSSLGSSEGKLTAGTDLIFLKILRKLKGLVFHSTQ